MDTQAIMDTLAIMDILAISDTLAIVVTPDTTTLAIRALDL